MQNASLVVMAKKPRTGSTKTRLCPPFTPIEAAQFYRCLMLDTLALAARVQEVEHCLAYAPLEASSYFQDLVPEGFSLIPQHGADLGERLANTLADRFQNGYQKVVVMNSDGPTLPLPYLNQAFQQLQHFDVSLGMGHDGGYYLIGMKQMQPQLFENISWSSDRVIFQTLDACRRLQLKVHQLPQWYDVDVGDDLQVSAIYTVIDFFCRHVVRKCRCQPALVRYDRFLQFITRNPIISYLPDSIKVRSGPGVSAIKKNLYVIWCLRFVISSVSVMARGVKAATQRGMKSEFAFIIRQSSFVVLKSFP